MPSFFSNILSRVSTTSVTSDETAPTTAAPAAPAPAAHETFAGTPSSSWASWMSPKAFLSQVMAQTLSEFFVIDNPKQQVQSKLMGGGDCNRIVLHDLQLQPQRRVLDGGDGGSQRSVLACRGTVKRVEFSWMWGGNDQTSFIREIVLTVQGIDVHVVRFTESRPDFEAIESTTNDAVLSSVRDAQSYLEQYVQQIMDHLTLNVQDVSVYIHLEDDAVDGELALHHSSKMMQLSVSLFCLLSLGKHRGTATGDNDGYQEVLSQRLSVERFFVNCLCHGERYPLLEPIGYAADVTRTQGRRFQDGFMEGLHLKGEVFYETTTADGTTDTTKEEEGRWTVRLGDRQTEMIGALIELVKLCQPSTPYVTSATVDENMPAPDSTELISHANDYAVKNRSSMLVLPIPALSLILGDDEDASSIYLPDCSVLCRLDGSVCQVRGGGTISINNGCSLLRLSQGVEWNLDGVTKRFVVRKNNDISSEDDSPVAHWNLEEEQLKGVAMSCIRIAEVLQRSTPSLDTQALWVGLEKAVTEEWSVWQAQNKAAVFTFSLEGRTSMRMSIRDTDGQLKWLDSTMESLCCAVKSDGSIQELSVGTIQAGPTSLGGGKVLLPPGRYVLKPERNSNGFRLDGNIEVHLDSMETAQGLMAFMSTFASILTPVDLTPIEYLSRELLSDFDVASVNLPFDISIPGIHASLTLPKSNISLSVVTVEHNIDVSVDSATARIGGMGEITMNGVKLSSIQKSILIASISRCVVDGYFHLCSPLTKAMVMFEDSRFRIKTGYLHVQPTFTEIQKTGAMSETKFYSPIPWPIVLQIERLRIDPSDFFPLVLRANSIGGSIQQRREDSMQLSLDDELMFQLDRDGDYVRFSVENVVIVLPFAFDSIPFFQVRNFRILSSSFGFIKATIPQVFATDDYVSLPMELAVELESQTVAEKLMDFFVSSLPSSAVSSQQPQPASFQIPFPIRITKVCFFLKDVNLTANLASIEVSGSRFAVKKIFVEDINGFSLSGNVLSVDLEHSLRGTLREVNLLHIPDTATIRCPQAISFQYDQQLLSLSVSNIAIELPDIRVVDGSGMSLTNPLPLPVSIRSGSVSVGVGSTGFSLTTGAIDLKAIPEGELIHLVIHGQLAMDLSHASTAGFLEASLGILDKEPIKMTFQPTTARMVAMECLCPQIGTTSFGKIVGSAQSMLYDPSSNAVVVDGDLNVYIENSEKAQQMFRACQPLVDYFTNNDSSDPGYAIIIPKAIVLTEHPVQTRIETDNFHYDGKNVFEVARMKVHEKSKAASASISGISGTVTPPATTVSFVEALYVPGCLQLNEPIQNIQCWYNDHPEVNEVSVVLPKVSAVMLPAAKQPMSETTGIPTPIALPCNLKCSVECIVMNSTKVKEAPTVIQKVFATAKIPSIDPFNPTQPLPNKALLHVSFERLQNAMLVLNNGQLDAELVDSSGEEFHSLLFRAQDGVVAAGFSTIDWDTVFFGSGGADKVEDVIFRLPFACIESLELGLKYEGAVIETETCIMVPMFVGTAQSTSEDIVKHYKNAILRRAPAFLAKANVFGSNLGDSAASTAGVVALGLGSSVASSAGAGVAGIIAYDGVVGAIRSGKAARGASVHEKYQFGDITRGSMRALGSVREGGAGVISSSAKEYADKNSGRLGSAAGSTVGLIAGSALLGPVGLVAGAIMGAKAGAAAFRNKQQQSEPSQATLSKESSQSSSQSFMNGASQPVDLLDDSNVPRESGEHPPMGAFAPPPNMQTPAHTAYPPAQEMVGAQPQPMLTHHESYQQQQPVPPSQHQQRQLADRGGGEGYKFGDFSRRIVAKGKAKDGRSSQDGYKFGDFTRGLFK